MKQTEANSFKILHSQKTKNTSIKLTELRYGQNLYTIKCLVGSKKEAVLINVFYI